jgi:hypothetical protein
MRMLGEKIKNLHRGNQEGTQRYTEEKETAK